MLMILNTSCKHVSHHQGGASLTVAIGLELLRLGLARQAPPGGVGLQLLQLADQQGQVLQQVPVLQQQLVDAGLSLHAGRALRRHLILQQLHLGVGAGILNHAGEGVGRWGGRLKTAQTTHAEPPTPFFLLI